MEIFKKILRQASRILLSMWFVLVILHSLFAGKVFLCNFSGSIPSFCFIIIPAVFLVPEVFRKKKNLFALLLIAVSLFAGAAQLDINFPDPGRNKLNNDQYGKIKICNWNTNCWTQYKDKDSFYAYLKKQNADIYILQEYLYAREWQDTGTDLSRVFSIYSGDPFFPPNYLAIDDTDRIQKEFTGYYYATHAQFVVISRFPIRHSHLDSSEQYMVTDIDIHGRLVRLFNVHILLHIEPGSPFTPYFYQAMHIRFKSRQLAFGHLKQDIADTKIDYLIAGDFNSTRAMGVMHTFFKDHTDAVNYTNDLFPLTFKYAGLKFWRFDYIMVPKLNKNIIIESYQNTDPGELSDHCSQRLVLNIRRVITP